MSSVRHTRQRQLMAAIFAAIANLALALEIPPSEGAPATPADPFAQIVAAMNQDDGSRTLCMSPSWPMEQVRSYVMRTLVSEGQTNRVPGETVGKALWHLFPCPFSPLRHELRPARVHEVEGAWLYPEASQKLRFGPKSGIVSPFGGNIPVRCDALGFYPGGEQRQTFIMGRQTSCPFRSTADMELSRKNPRVASWTLSDKGRLSVTRTDYPDHIEEWDMFVVQKPFSFEDIGFEQGDLVGYLRRSKSNALGFSEQFRHLKRLPDSLTSQN